MKRASTKTQGVVFLMLAAAIRAFNDKQLTISEYESVIQDCNDLLGSN